LKFLIDEGQARRIEDWARLVLTPDPHGDPALGGAYRTVSLYCDTPELGVYRRAAAHRGHKFRVRRYGAMPWAFLERKSKQDDRVRKRRTPVPLEELPLLARPTSSSAWPGHWFHHRLRAGRLLPACRIVYQRTAFAGSCEHGPLRLTLDRRLHGTLTDEWSLAPAEGGLPLLAARAILELKFRSALPAPFRALVRDMGLTASPVSKYRLCREAWGADGECREVGGV
jgi:hypothetical protein